MAWAMDAMAAQGASADRVTLVGGGARSEAVRQIAPSILGVPVDVPEAGEDVADGAARQAAWVLSGAAEPPTWVYRSVDTYEGEPMPELFGRFRAAVDRVVAEQEP
jgi:xylulokinase